MKSLMLVLILELVALNSSSATLASPTPVGPPGSGLLKIPPNPAVKITYEKDGGTVQLSVEGEHRHASSVCVGLEGSRGITYLDVLTKFAEPGHTDRWAYSVVLYPEFGCKWDDPKSTRQVTQYKGRGEPLRDDAGRPMIPKSFRFNPQFVFPNTK